MRWRHSFVALILIVSFAAVGGSQTAATSQDRVTPDFRVQVRGQHGADFTVRMEDYSALRTQLQQGLPALAVTDDPAAIRRAEHALAKRIRRARHGAKQGEVFTAVIGAEFRQVLRLAMNDNTWAAIMEDNPGQFSRQINGTYPKKRPLSTMPPNILAALPALPADVQYRFVGRDLVLHDTRANIILDKIPDAIECIECERMTRDR